MHFDIFEVKCLFRGVQYISFCVKTACSITFKWPLRNLVQMMGDGVNPYQMDIECKGKVKLLFFNSNLVEGGGGGRRV